MARRWLRAFGLLAIALPAVWAAGCKGTSDSAVAKDEQAAGEDGLLERPRQLLPDVEALPPTGGLAAPAEPAAPAPSAPAAETVAAAPAPAVAVALPAAVQQAADELAAKSPTIRTVAFNLSGTRTTTDDAAPGMPGPPLNGRFEAVPPNQFRIEGTSEMAGREVKVLMVINGPAMWMEIREAASDQVKQVIKMDLEAMPGATQTESTSPTGSASPDVASVLANMGKEFAFEAVRDETLDDEACKVFEGKKRDETVRVWFSTTDGLVRRVQHADASDKVTEDIRITNIETNLPLPMSRFEYTPPAGVPVMDMSELLKQTMEGLGGDAEEAVAEPGETPAEDNDDAAYPEND